MRELSLDDNKYIFLSFCKYLSDSLNGTIQFKDPGFYGDTACAVCRWISLNQYTGLQWDT